VNDHFDKANALLKELLENQCDLEDERWQAVGDILQEGCLRLSRFRFVERYNRSILDFHLHGSLVFDVGYGRRNRSWKFCAVLQRGSDKYATKCGMSKNVPAVYYGDGRVKATMLVDVREFTQHPKQLRSRIPSVIRLQTLDKCICFIGNPLEQLLLREQDVFWNGRTVSSGTGVQKRELAFPRNLFRHRFSIVPFDKLEKQVIERRPELIKHFASKERNVGRRLSNDAQCFFAIRISDNFVRLTSCVFGDASLDQLAMIECPRKFPTSGLNREAAHAKENSNNS